VTIFCKVSLVNQWVHLTDERNAVIAPTAGSGVPGAPHPPAFRPAPGTELHTTVLFLDLNADDLSTGLHHHQRHPHLQLSAYEEELLPVYGHNSILPKELAGRFFQLPLISTWDEEEEEDEEGGNSSCNSSCNSGTTTATASWDSSLQATV
jgi:hypothetical protein